MKLDEVKQLFYITHIENLGSILERGILSHSRVQDLPHKRIDMPEVQERRRTKRISGGTLLHDYANLYFSGRNPMLFKRKDEHKEICVLRISLEVLKIPGVVVATGNAASDYTSFYPPESGIEKLDRKLVYARKWTDDDPIIRARKSVAKCAEVLVPDLVPPSLIFGVYVSSQETEQKLARSYPGLQIEQNLIIFFQE
jgi:ssDNA thymidine ADP-ribosyltransferase DarT-like protein